MTPYPSSAPAIIIAGAGAVGLCLALDLAWRGVRVTLIEPRGPGEAPPPKCNHVAARTMEVFRRLGFVDEVRNGGLPADHPHDVAYRTSFTGIELARIAIPCRRDRYTEEAGPDCGWPTPEPPHRINQIYLEPILFAKAAENPLINIWCEHSVVDVDQDPDKVSVHIEDLTTGQRKRLCATYLIGCDGGRSTVRKKLGIEFHGDAVVQRCQTSLIDAPTLMSRLKVPPAWGTFSLNPRRTGNCYAIDGKSKWVIHNYLREDEPSFDSVDRKWAIRTILGVEPDFEFEILATEDWYGRRLLAERFRQGRVFLCGDAAHIWVPYAGYGMNAGIADAMNLSWLLAANVSGWAPADILDAYERERWPITEQVSHFVMNHAHAMAQQRRQVPEDIEAQSAQGQHSRDLVGQRAYDLNVQQYCAAGLNFGYYYDASPIIAHDDEPAPAYTMSTYVPSTVPGCRTPHYWLPDGTSLYDRLGPWFTLLRFDPGASAAPLVDAAHARGVPLEVLDLDPATSPNHYDHTMLLSRPDQHIAWRGDRLPSDAHGLLALVIGAGSGHRAPKTPGPKT